MKATTLRKFQEIGNGMVNAMLKNWIHLFEEGEYQYEEVSRLIMTALLTLNLSGQITDEEHTEFVKYFTGYLLNQRRRSLVA